MRDKLVHRFIIGTFVSLYLLVSIISTIHVVEFFELSNPRWLAISLAIGFELGAAASLASLVILDKMNKTLIWALFGSITLMQIQGNMYYAFVHMADFQGWSELFGLFEEEVIYQKRILSAVSGGILPLVALGFIKSLVDYIKPEKDKVPEMAEKITEEEIKEVSVQEEKLEDPVNVKPIFTPPINSISGGTSEDNLIIEKEPIDEKKINILEKAVEIKDVEIVNPETPVENLSNEGIVEINSQEEPNQIEIQKGNFSYSTEELEEIKEWDPTLEDGLEEEPAIEEIPTEELASFMEEPAVDPSGVIGGYYGSIPVEGSSIRIEENHILPVNSNIPPRKNTGIIDNSGGVHLNPTRL